MDKQKISEVLDAAILLIEKCGGEGGTPGPCPAGQNPAGGSGAPAAKPGKKPPKKPELPHLAPLDYGPDKKKPPAHHLAPLDYTKTPTKPGPPKGRTAWEKVVNIGFTMLKQAGAKLDAKITEVKAKLDDEFKISAMGKEIKGKVDGFVGKVAQARAAIEKSVKAIHKRVHSTLDKMETNLKKSAELDPHESQLHTDMQVLKQHLSMIQVLEDSMVTISEIIDQIGQTPKEDA